MYSNRSTLKNRLRYRNQSTNYYSRLKCITNYEQVYRLTFKKKNKYLCTGLYETVLPNKPDVCKMYMESRVYKLNQSRKSYPLWAQIVARKINELLEKKQIESTRKIVLDLGFQKKIRYQEFLLELRSLANFNV